MFPIVGYFGSKNTPLRAKQQSNIVFEKVYISEDAYRCGSLIGGINILLYHTNDKLSYKHLFVQEMLVFCHGGISQ